MLITPLIAEAKTFWEIWAQPTATFCAGTLAIFGALFLAKVGFKNTLAQQQADFFMKLRLEVEKNRQESERKRIFLLAEYYGKLFALQDDYILYYGMTKESPTRDSKQLAQQRIDSHFRFQAQWQQISLIEFNKERNEALLEMMVIFNAFDDKHTPTEAAAALKEAAWRSARILLKISKSMHAELKGVQTQQTPIEETPAQS